MQLQSATHKSSRRLCHTCWAEALVDEVVAAQRKPEDLEGMSLPGSTTSLKHDIPEQPSRAANSN